MRLHNILFESETRKSTVTYCLMALQVDLRFQVIPKLHIFFAFRISRQQLDLLNPVKPNNRLSLRMKNLNLMCKQGLIYFAMIGNYKMRKITRENYSSGK